MNEPELRDLHKGLKEEELISIIINQQHTIRVLSELDMKGFNEFNKEIDKVTEAMNFLESKGYFVYNLWHVQDVQRNFECTNEEAQEVLEGALTNDWIMEQINEGIHCTAGELNIKLRDNE